MSSEKDDLSFESAWKKQVEQEQKKPVEETKPESNPQMEHQQPNFRGQKDMVENRQKFVMPSKPKETTPKKEVEVADTPSSKEGDDFDVEWWFGFISGQIYRQSEEHNLIPLNGGKACQWFLYHFLMVR